MADFRKVIEEIEDLQNRGKLSARDFEREISRALNAKLPFSVLSNVLLYRTDLYGGTAEDRNHLTYEIDNLYHYRKEEIDHIIVIETKAQTIRSVDGDWLVQYTGSPGGNVKDSSVIRQLVSQRSRY